MFVPILFFFIRVFVVTGIIAPSRTPVFCRAEGSMGFSKRLGGACVDLHLEFGNSQSSTCFADRGSLKKIVPVHKTNSQETRTPPQPQERKDGQPAADPW